MYQVSQNGLDIIGFLIDRLASDFKPYLNTVLTSIVDRWKFGFGLWEKTFWWMLKADDNWNGRKFYRNFMSGWETQGRVWGRRPTLPCASWWTPPSPPNSSLRSSSRIFLTRMARYTHGELVMVLSSSPEHRHGVNESSLINLFSGAWGAASPTTKHTECPWSSNLECEQVHPQYCGWAQRFPGDRYS